ncbi:hypothetical protein V1477_006858 [Vespula maculifrons]|uniref:Uncharacterized protein n=1 Tax=Vespula maculifrons TaxID=7453 RepID=A0ABD2CH32_VESMC
MTLRSVSEIRSAVALFRVSRLVFSWKCGTRVTDEGPTFMEVSSRYSLIPSPPPPPFSSFPLKRSTVSPLERRLPWGSRENEICISRGCVLLAIRNAIIESNLPGITVARISDLTVIVQPHRGLESPGQILKNALGLAEICQEVGIRVTGRAFTIGCSGTSQTGIVTPPTYLSDGRFLCNGVASDRTFLPAFILILVPIGLAL